MVPVISAIEITICVPTKTFRMAIPDLLPKNFPFKTVTILKEEMTKAGYNPANNDPTKKNHKESKPKHGSWYNPESKRLFPLPVPVS